MKQRFFRTCTGKERKGDSLATEYITLSAVLLLSLIGHNMTVVYATGDRKSVV